MSVKNVITLARGTVTISQVTLGKNPEITHQVSADWNPSTVENMISALQPLLEQHPSELKKVRLLLADDACYVLHLATTTLGDIELENRQAVFSQVVSSQIPETLLDDEWDYAITQDDQNQETLVAFAPVLSMYRRFLDAAEQLNLEVVTIEPTTLATTRHPDPIIGLALKKGLSGPDTTTLALEPSPSGVASQSTGPALRKYWWLAALVVLAFGLSLGLTLLGYFRLAK